MRELRTQIDIDCPLEDTWGLLMDFRSWKDWNPIVNQVRGEASLGNRLDIVMQGAEGKSGQKYSAVVTEMKTPTYFHWRAKMMAGFLFTNDKIFELHENGKGTRLIHIERFSGLLVPLFWGKLKNGALPMLKSMNMALKNAAEQVLN